MKKPLFISTLMLAAIGSFAQGTISVGNGITATRFPIYGPQVGSELTQVVGNGPLSTPPGTNVYTGALLSGSRWRIEFWAGPSTATDFSGLTLITSTTFRTAANPNALPNGITTTIFGTIPNVPADGLAKLGVRVWDTQSGASYDLAAVRGQSPSLSLSAGLGGGLTTPPNWVGQSFSLVSAVPEPSSMALAGIGAASLLIFRRRK